MTRATSAELRMALRDMLSLWYSANDPATPGLTIPAQVRYAEAHLSESSDDLNELIDNRAAWLAEWNATPDTTRDPFAEDSFVGFDRSIERARERAGKDAA